VMCNELLAGGFNGSGADVEVFKDQWRELLNRSDPFYNVNLTKKYYDFSPDIDP